MFIWRGVASGVPMREFERVMGVDPEAIFAVKVTCAKIPGIVVLPPPTSAMTPQMSWMVP